MCTTCGCGQSETRIESGADGHERRLPKDTVHGHTHPHDVEYHYHGEVDHEHLLHHADGSVHSHAHAHDLWHGHGSDLHYGHGPAATHVPGMSQARIVQIEQDILAKNDAYAAQNRRRLRERGIFAVNLVSSPGSGKTTLLVRTIESLRDRLPICVIVFPGSGISDNLADKAHALGIPLYDFRPEGARRDGQGVRAGFGR